MSILAARMAQTVPPAPCDGCINSRVCKAGLACYRFVHYIESAMPKADRRFPVPPSDPDVPKGEWFNAVYGA